MILVHGERHARQIRVAVVGIDVAAEHEIAQRIENVAVLISLDALHNMRMRAHNDIRARFDRRAADGALFPGEVVAVFAAPVERRDHNLTARLTERFHIRADVLFAALVGEAVAGHADFHAVLFKNAQLSAAGNDNPRRFQIGKVYRGERAQRGRFREFYQADIDVIGDGKLDISNEAEIPAIIYQAFSKMGLRRFQIRVNNRKILNGFYAMLGLTDKSGDIMRTVDKLDKIGPDKVAELLVQSGLSPEQAREILSFTSITGTNEEVLTALEGYRGRNEVFDLGLDELNAVTKYLAAFGVPETHFAVDLTIARGLDYYTGTVYETTMLDHPEIGSICSGGRYDNLAEYYTNKQLPGVGISIGLTRLFFVLEDQGYLNDALNTAPADALILPMTEDLAPAISLATQLRQAGIRTQIQAERKKFKQKLSYADKLRIPYAVILGEDEIREGLAAVKDLATGEQVKLAPGQAAAHILAGLDRLNQGTPILDRV